MPAGLPTHLSHFSFHLNGAQAPKALLDDMLDCTVENSLHLPDMATLRIADVAFKWVDDAKLREGVAIEVFGGDESDRELKSLFEGEITNIELDMAAHGAPSLIVRCFDRSHRLHRGRQARSFVQMTDSDIVKKVGAEAGFSVRADATSQVHDWVFQNNQTNWEFLCERARRNGFRLYVQNETDLYFKAVSDKGAGTIQLEWGQSLRSFRPRTNLSPQVDEVMVRGWDPKTKATILGRCQTPKGVPQIGGGGTGSSLAKKSFGAARMVVVDRPVHSQGEADALARSICDDIGAGFIEADGLCYGQPTLMPGMEVQIKEIGTRFSGSYFVTSTTHTYTPAEGAYSTLFSVSGKRNSTLLGLLEDLGAGARSPLGGNIVIGVVTDNQDPDNLGRVKVKYPWLSDDHTSFWARQSAPMAGSSRGFYFLPEIDDEVLVAFEHGDIRRPYIIGALWNGKDKPIEGNSKAVTGGKVQRRTIKTRIGHTILLEDTGDKGEMSLTTKAGHKIRIRDDEDLILIEDKTGKNKITIKSSDNSIAAECMGNFSVDAKGKVSIKGTQGIDVQTPATMNLKSTGPATLESSAPLTVKSSAILTVQGSLVKIN